MQYYPNNNLKRNGHMQWLWARVIVLMTLITPFHCNMLLAQEGKPNILLMMTDDQGYGDVGCHGNPYLKTPHLDALAAESVEMTHFFTYPSCSPTRAGLMTGRYPYRTGVVGVTQTSHLMNTAEVTIAEILREAGYRTGIFGKWHLGDNYPMRPSDQGFEESLVHKAGGIGQAADPPGNSYFDPILQHNDVPAKYEGYCDDIFTDAAMDFISQQSDQPFFAYLATNLPHFPLDVPDEKADPYRKMGLHEDNARTYGMITNIDDNVGRILAKIEELGIAENTIVIFLSDNGPRHRRTKNDVYPGRYVANLRGTKTSVYENGTRVPFFIRWPEKLPRGNKINTMGTMIDVLPTLLDACAIDPPKEVRIDGVSLLPLLEGKESNLPDRVYFTQWHQGPVPFEYVHFAVRGQQYKLIAPQDDPHHIVYQPSDQELKQILGSLELYDVENDSSERINIAKKHPEIVLDYLEKYENWFDDVTAERDARGIQRIFLGNAAQPKVQLSRFDWGGPRNITGNSYGYWHVHTETSRYRITLHYDKAQMNGTAHIRYGEVHEEKPIREGDIQTEFENVLLEEGTGNFQAFLKIERLPTGVRYVDVEKMD